VMLLARAATEAQRTLAPDACNGATYTPEELGAEVDAEGRPVDPPEMGQPSRSGDSSISRHQSRPSHSQSSYSQEMDGEHLMRMMEKLFGSKPAWVIEAITGFKPKSPSELTRSQIEQVTEAIDLIGDVAARFEIDDVLGWVDVAEAEGTDLTSQAALEDAAQWHTSESIDASPPPGQNKEPASTDDDIDYDARRRTLRKWLESRARPDELEAVSTAYGKITDWPLAERRKAKKVIAPVHARAKVRDAYEKATDEDDRQARCNAVADELKELVDPWPRGDQERVNDAFREELARLRRAHESERAVESIANRESALGSTGPSSEEPSQDQEVRDDEDVDWDAITDGDNSDLPPGLFDDSSSPESAADDGTGDP